MRRLSLLLFSLFLVFCLTLGATEPTIKTIKPLGGGDYTTLQAWEDWADDQANAAQWAECYDGGNLGAVIIGGWSTAPDATDYPRIYTPLAERHEGKDNSVGAYIDTASASCVLIGENYTRIEGLRMEGGGNYDTVRWSSLTNIVIDSNLIINPSTSGTCIEVDGLYDSDGTVTVQNNIVITEDGNTNGITILGNYDGVVNLYNNTAHKTEVSDGGRYGIFFSVSAGVTITGDVKNNLVTVYDNCFYESGDGTLTVTSSNNLSSDLTSNDFGGSNHLESKTAANQFVNAASDWNLKIGADALEAGVTIGTFDHDALHIAADNWRPQHINWDMGAIERLLDYESYMVLLLHFNGADEATTTVDSSASAHEITFVNDTQLETANKKFGTASCIYDGTLDYTTIPASADLGDFGSGAFTIDFWYYTSADTTRQYFFSPGVGTATHYGLGLDYDSVGTHKLGLWASSTGSSWDMIDADPAGNGICATTLPMDQWNHIALTRSGNVWRVFLNGVVDLEITVAGTLYDRSGTLFNMGRTSYDGGSFYGWGLVDEFRVLKGTAAWIDDFSVPTEEYEAPTTTMNKLMSAGASQKKVSAGTVQKIYGAN